MSKNKGGANSAALATYAALLLFALPVLGGRAAAASGADYPEILARGEIAKLPPAIAARDDRILRVLDKGTDAATLPLLATLTPQDHPYVLTGAFGEIAELQRDAVKTQYRQQLDAYVLRHFSSLGNAVLRPKELNMWTGSLQWNIVVALGCAGDPGVLKWAHHFIHADGSVGSWALDYPAVREAIACNSTHSDRPGFLKRALRAQGRNKWFWYDLYFDKAVKADVPGDLRVIDSIPSMGWDTPVQQTTYRTELMALDPRIVLDDMLANPAHRPTPTYTFDIIYSSAVIAGGLPRNVFYDDMSRMQLYSKETLDYEMRNEDQTRGKETSAIIDSVNRFFSTHPT